MSDTQLISCPKCGVVIDWSTLPDSKKVDYNDIEDGFYQETQCPVCKAFIKFQRNYIGEVYRP
jgi:uncharacterized C2H2 Zn-finger protein